MSIKDSLSYINNAAISLLERDMPVLCMDTFKDSLDMNLLLTEQALRNSQGIPFTTNHHVNTVSLLVRNTSKRLVCCMDQNMKLSSTKNSNPVIVLDFDSEDCFESIVTMPSSVLACTDYLFRMDYEHGATHRAVPRLESSYKRDIKIDSAIAFFNYGVACRRFNTSHSKQQQEDLFDMECCFDNESYGDVQLMNEAMKLFRAAYHMMSSHLSDLYKRMNTEYHIIVQDRQELLNVIRIVLLAKLITMNLSTLSYDMCMLELGDEYYSKYKPLSDLFHILYNEWKKLPSICAGAAAAA